MYTLYKTLTGLSGPALRLLLKKRIAKGKEDAIRYVEKSAIIETPRPEGNLIWLHAASVGEVQSALIIINKISDTYPNRKILVTTGTLTSAAIITPKLPPTAIHQFYPLDHPKWVEKFLNHWQPNCIFWMESELWPNMLIQIKQRGIPAALLNAHMSEKSYSSWTKMRSLTGAMLQAFNKVLCQTDIDKQRYDDLGAKQTRITDNLKYSAPPLPVDIDSKSALLDSLGKRPIWLYASTHSPEEKIACNIHKRLRAHIPDLLTIVVPRHPERRSEIEQDCRDTGLNICFRGEGKTLPKKKDDVYIADTLGELGLFYDLSPISCIGRSLSTDGGGGHNPIEAALHNSTVLHGPNVQNLQQIFDEMHAQNAAIQCANEDVLYEHILSLLQDPEKAQELQQRAYTYATRKSGVIDTVMQEIIPLLENIDTIDHCNNC